MISLLLNYVGEKSMAEGFDSFLRQWQISFILETELQLFANRVYFRALGIQLLSHSFINAIKNRDIYLFVYSADFPSTE